jgi:NitT/TauT family transport system permease protein
MSDGAWSPARIWIARLIVLGTFFGSWEWASATRAIDPILIGRPSGIVAFIWRETFVEQSLLIDFGYTLTATLLAFLLGSVSGILVGMLFVTRPNVEAVLSPILMALNSMPRIALAPLFLIWFGLGIGSKIALGFSLTFFIVLTNTVAGGRGVNPDHITLAETLGASRGQIFRKFTLPSAVPVIFNGLRLGLIFSLLGVIGGEIIASEHGLGGTLQLLAASFKTSGVFGVIILLSMVGLSITWIMTWLENRLLRWR